MGEMKNGFWGRSDYRHDELPRAGVLMVNLGTPAAATPAACRRYLAEFLGDPRVIEMSVLLRTLLLHGVILRVRPRKSAASYRKIWRPDGSPLLVYSRALEQALREALAIRMPGPVSVALAMRYGEPRLEAALRLLLEAGVERLLVLPLYPQYSGATTGSTADAVGAALSRLRRVPAVRFVDHYHDHPRYIDAVANSVASHWKVHGRTERLLMSFHGMPQATLAAGDPYHCHCQATARMIARVLDLPRQDWAVAFQSRFGRAAWLQPDTRDTLVGWASAGVSSVTVVCPGFAVDCLETLEEVALRYREVFLGAGGIRFDYISALNGEREHAELLAEVVAREMSGWPEALASYSEATIKRAAGSRVERARRLGASD